LTEPSQYLDEMQDIRLWYERMSVILFRHIVCFIDRHLHLEIRVSNYRLHFKLLSELLNDVKNNPPLRGRLLEEPCDDVEIGHTALLYYCATRWLSRAKVPDRVTGMESSSQFYE
jgi:hypothetical protein